MRKKQPCEIRNPYAANKHDMTLQTTKANWIYMDYNWELAIVNKVPFKFTGMQRAKALNTKYSKPWD